LADTFGYIGAMSGSLSWVYVQFNLILFINQGP